MDTRIYDFSIRVLVCPDEGEFSAHALEMDLVAYGRTEDLTIKAMEELVECQISFAANKSDDNLLLFPAPKECNLLLFPAPKECFERWETAHTAALKKQVLGDKSVKVRARAICISFTKREISHIIRHRSKPLVETSCA